MDEFEEERGRWPGCSMRSGMSPSAPPVEEEEEEEETPARSSIARIKTSSSSARLSMSSSDMFHGLATRGRICFRRARRAIFCFAEGWWVVSVSRVSS